MTGEYERTNDNRLMVVPATAGTYYPTAAMMGEQASGLKASADTASGTQGNSYFAAAGAPTTPDLKKGFLLKKVFVHTAIAGTITIEAHNGTALLPALSSATAGTVWDTQHDGVVVWGGFRIVTSANSLVFVEYGLVGGD